MTDAHVGMGTDGRPVTPRSARSQGRPPVHGLKTLRRAVTQLTTRRLDGRSAIAVAVRRWKEDVRRDLGGDLTRAQDTILEAAAQAWVILSSLDDWIARQPSLVTKKRRVLDVVVQRMQIAEGLARNLERLGLARVARQVDLAAQLAALHRSEEREISPGGKKSVESAESPLGQSLAGDSLSAESAESAERVLPLAREQEKP